MQFIEGGPHIPDELIEELEDGNVALFTGAGVSKGIGLPLFDELVRDVYAHLHQWMAPQEKQEFDNHNYDRTLALFETRLGGGPQVREAVQARLTIPSGIHLPLHSAILELARTPEVAYRLVTTNFDRGFVMADPSIGFETAPAMPLPRRSRWRRPVHLHGLIGAEGRTLNDLVLTSADFGDAYITSGWASRFVAELFARFSVLFIGYSVSDPVMRYLVDALAVSKAHGEHSRQVFALVPSKSGEPDEHVRQLWAARGVAAIVYEMDATHSRLERTLVEWAGIHKSGLAGRVSVVAQLADNPPSGSGQDYHSSQMIWALSDKSGLASRKFLSLSPPIEWLEVLEQSELMKLPYASSVGQEWLGFHIQQVHPISGSLHQWLLGHLEKSEVVSKAIERNSILEWSFRWELHRKLYYFKQPVAEPYRRFWELVGSTSIMNASIDFPTKTFELIDRLKSGQADPLLLLESTDQLRPVAVLSKPTLRKLLGGTTSPPRNVLDLIDFDVEVIAGVHTDELINSLKACIQANPSLLTPILLRANAQLQRALTMFAAAGKAEEAFDPSIFQIQSLRRDSSTVYRWTALVLLVRDAVVLAKDDRSLIGALVELWLRLPYPIFRRLALFGMYESDAFEADECCRLLLDIPKRLFWHYSNEEFTVPLIAKVWPRLNEPEATQLTDAVLEGPPRSLFVSEISQEEFEGHADRIRWRFLSIMEATGRPLSPPAAAKLASLRSGPFKDAKPPKEVEEDDDVQGAYLGLPTFASKDIEDFNQLEISAMVAEIARRVTDNSRDLDLLRTWANRYPERALDLLDGLVTGGVQDVDSWVAIVDGLSSSDTKGTTLDRTTMLVPRLSKAVRSRVVGNLSSWMERASSKVPLTPEFLSAWDALLELVADSPWTDTGVAFMSAFSSPIGQLTLVLLNRWLASSPKRASGIEPEVRERIERLLTTAQPQLRRTRIIVAANLYSLHFVDQPWVKAVLIPLFAWDGDTAVEMWQGYLANHRWYPDLLGDIKPSLLMALTNRSQLGESAKSLWRFFAGILAYSPSSLSEHELTNGLQSLDKDALASLAASFAEVIHHAEPSGRHELWERGVARTLRLWPLDKELQSEPLSNTLVKLATDLEDDFEAVAAAIRNLIEPVKDLTMLLYGLAQTTLPEKHPRTVVLLLSSVVDPHSSQPYFDPGAHALLSRVKSADVEVATMPEFHSLAKTGWFDL